MRLKAAKWGLKMVITKSYEYILEVMDSTEKFVAEHATMVDPIKLGLDERVAPKLFVADGAIIVSKGNDNRLQYYGGFEYVNKEFRHEIGDYVFYLSDDPRILEHLNDYEDSFFDAE